MRFTTVQVEQTKQLWEGFSSRMARLAAHRKELLKLLEGQEAANHVLNALSTAPVMVEPATQLMDNVRLQQEVLLHTMRAFICGVVSPWQYGHILAFSHPHHAAIMDLI